MELYWKILIIAGLVILFFGGIGYLIYIKTRKPKQRWNAKIYQLGEGVREEYLKNRDGKLISNLKLKDLKPYGEDILVKEELEYGRTVYTLKRLGLTTNAVTADMVEVWADNKKEVSVLILENTATILKKGYDNDFGSVIFRPEKREKIEAIVSDSSIKKERYRKEKDILTAISPWITAMVVAGIILGSIYIEGETRKQVSKDNKEIQAMILQTQIDITKILDTSIQKNIKLIQAGERERILYELNITDRNKPNIPSIE